MELNELLMNVKLMSNRIENEIKKELSHDKDIISVDVDHHCHNFEFYIEFRANNGVNLVGYSLSLNKSLECIQYSRGVRDTNGGYSFLSAIKGLAPSRYYEVINKVIKYNYLLCSDKNVILSDKKGE